MSHNITITVERHPDYPDEAEIEWERADNDCPREDGIWQECMEPECRAQRVEQLSDADQHSSENDELVRHGHKHGFRDGWLADLDLGICLLSVDGVRQGISDELYRLDRKGHLSSGDRFAVEADWEGDDDWAVTLDPKSPDYQSGESNG